MTRCLTCLSAGGTAISISAVEESFCSFCCPNLVSLEIVVVVVVVVEGVVVEGVVAVGVVAVVVVVVLVAVEAFESELESLVVFFVSLK